MNSLFVNADDFGLHSSVNSAIADCVEFGSVNSISVIANGSAPDFKMLNSFIQKGIFVGIHLTWVGEPWLTQSFFIRDWKQLIQKIILGGKDFRLKMQLEAEAQIAVLLKEKIHPGHIDSHQHVHHFPGIWNMTNELKTKYAIEKIRVARVKSSSLLRKNIAGFTLNTLAGLHEKESNGFYVTGIKHAGNYNTLLFAEELKDASGSATELIVHPGKSNVQLNKSYAHWNFNWESEYAALMSIGLLRLIAENNFELS